MGDYILTKSGKAAIVHPCKGGPVGASGAEFTLGFPFVIKNDGITTADLVVRLADQQTGESFNLKIRADGRYCDELVDTILSGIPVGHSLLWGA